MLLWVTERSGDARRCLRMPNASATATANISTTAFNPNIPIVPTRLGIHRFSQSWRAGDLGEAIDTLSGNVNFSLPAQRRILSFYIAGHKCIITNAGYPNAGGTTRQRP